MDIFPVQILDSMYIQKSFSPNMPGEFGGGTVVLNTKSMPDKAYAKFSLGSPIIQRWAQYAATPMAVRIGLELMTAVELYRNHCSLVEGIPMFF